MKDCLFGSLRLKIEFLSSDNIRMDDTRQFNFLGLRFNNYTSLEVINILDNFIHSRKPHRLSTITAELAVRASEDKKLKDFYNNADLLTVDSFVIYYAAKIFGKPIKEPVNATRLFFEFLKVAQESGYRLYLLGAAQDVVDNAVATLKSKFPRINIVGWHNGYFDFDNNTKLIEEIRKTKPDVVFVAMSSPLKEKFMDKNFDELGVPVLMPVGGCFDIVGGKCKLAPLWLSGLGLEWFYRLMQEPKRLWRRYLITNLKFLFLVSKEIFCKSI